jgi:hypothetical protein
MRACLLGSLAAICCSANADPAVATPPPGSVFAEWNYTPEDVASGLLLNLLFSNDATPGPEAP